MISQGIPDIELYLDRYLSVIRSMAFKNKFLEKILAIAPALNYIRKKKRKEDSGYVSF
jgi:hypothetical protein